MAMPVASLIHPRDEILAVIERIYRYRMTTTSGGNVSLREPNGTIWITPARVDKGSLRREDIVCVRSTGAIEGPHPPSSEFPFHQAIYNARPDLHGIVHAHPVALVAFSLVRQTPDTHLFHQARHVCGDVGFAPYQLPGSSALGREIAQVFTAGLDCAVLENHGIVTGGASLATAFHRFETLEFTARTVIRARALGEIRYLDANQLGVPERRPARLEELTRRAAPSSEEKELRRTLAEFVRRAYRQRLFISTQGTFSARLDDAPSFLITPYSADRGALDPAALVLIRDGRVEPGLLPSRAARAHDAIYRRHPSIGAVINAYPVNATAFSVTAAAVDSRTIPESYLVLRDVARLPFGIQFAEPAALAQALSPERPTALLENDGVLVAGASVLAAFDRLEVLEATAQALVESRALGPLSPMPDDVINELDRAFGMPAAPAR
jgi:L-fuculose-phosphate aldolase